MNKSELSIKKQTSCKPTIDEIEEGFNMHEYNGLELMLLQLGDDPDKFDHYIKAKISKKR